MFYISQETDILKKLQNNLGGEWYYDKISSGDYASTFYLFSKLEKLLSKML